MQLQLNVYLYNKQIEIMTLQEITKLADKIAKELNIVASYDVKMKIALRAAQEIAKAEGNITANCHIEICENHINISDGHDSLSNKEGYIQGFFLGSVMKFKETQGEKFTRLALEKFRNNAA